MDFSSLATTILLLHHGMEVACMSRPVSPATMETWKEKKKSKHKPIIIAIKLNNVKELRSKYQTTSTELCMCKRKELS